MCELPWRPPATSDLPDPRIATFAVIANTPGVTSIALHAWLLTSHKDMPNFVIPTKDRNDVIAYILSLKAR